MRISRISLFLIVFALVASACSGSDEDAAVANTGTEAAAESTTSSTSTSTTAAPTTTQGPPEPVTLGFEMADGFGDPLNEFYSWLADDRNPQPNAPAGLLEHVAGTARANPGEVGAVSSSQMSNGDSVAVARVDNDILLLVEDGSGWRIVGAALDGLTPWLGAEPRMVLVLGSDARVGQNQQRYRADSVHILTVVPDQGAGAIVGFPRDAYTEGPIRGFDKLTHHMASAGPEVMLEVVTDLTQLDIEGYFVTGFLGFETLMTELGGLYIDLPSVMRSGNNWANFPAGPQNLTPVRALQLARIRKGLAGGDFTRSLNQGRIMQAAMDMVQVPGIDMLPEWVRILLDSVWTDLSTEDVLTLGASAYFMESTALTNIVLPGTVGTTSGGASVVFLDPEAEAIYRDLEDGLLEPATDEE
ncbi:MAG: LCP family protein [Acidimicrobiia bacterium]|nr:LCP family protein [Acidimicrobiia bacterium]